MSETDGYWAANLACADAASRSGGRLTAFARITPDEVQDGVLEEALIAGARGIKLHGQQFLQRRGEATLVLVADVCVGVEHAAPGQFVDQASEPGSQQVVGIHLIIRPGRHCGRPCRPGGPACRGWPPGAAAWRLTGIEHHEDHLR